VVGQTPRAEAGIVGKQSQDPRERRLAAGEEPRRSFRRLGEDVDEILGRGIGSQQASHRT
jgi:hypothetical protein